MGISYGKGFEKAALHACVQTHQVALGAPRLTLMLLQITVTIPYSHCPLSNSSPHRNGYNKDTWSIALSTGKGKHGLVAGTREANKPRQTATLKRQNVCQQKQREKEGSLSSQNRAVSLQA